MTRNRLSLLVENVTNICVKINLNVPQLFYTLCYFHFTDEKTSVSEELVQGYTWEIDV